MNNARTEMWVKYYIPSYLYAGLIFALSSYPLVVPTTLPTFSDKWIHFFEYGIFGLLLARSYLHAGRSIFKKHIIIFAFLTGVIIAFLDECYQNSVPHRGFEIFDLSADILGSLTGAILYKSRLLSRKEKDNAFK